MPACAHCTPGLWSTDGPQAGAQGRREAAAHHTLHELLTQIAPYLRVVRRCLASNVEY